MGLWQIIMIGMYFLNMGLAIALHGQPKKGNHNILTTMIGSGIGIFILYMGGFFNG